MQHNGMADAFRKEYRELTDEEKQSISTIKENASNLLHSIMLMPSGREQSLAITNLEQSVMWAVKGITG